MKFSGSKSETKEVSIPIKQNTDSLTITTETPKIAKEVVKEDLKPLVVNKETTTNDVAFLNFDRVNTEWVYFKRESKRIEKRHKKDIKKKFNP